MELVDVHRIALDEVSENLLHDVQGTARQINEWRPLKPDMVEKVRQELLGERVFSSNSIEGNTYDLRETREILRTGHIDLARKREGTEVVNLGNAIEYLQKELVGSESPHTVKKFLSVHGILLSDIDGHWAGRFREKDVQITGSKHQPPEHRFVPDLVDRFFERLSGARDVDPILLAVWAHWTIASIHPFRDGNGRMARLWQDLVLYRGGLTCAIIPPQDRTEYLSSLEAADDGDFNLLTQLTARRVASTLDKFVAAQQEEKELTDWAEELAAEDTARTAETRKLIYIRWSRKMEQLRYAFQLCASKIAKTSADIDVQHWPYDIIDQAKWEDLGSGVSTKTWFFTLNFRRGQLRLRYFFFFGRHFPSDTDTADSGPEARVCLLVSEQEQGEGQAERLGLRGKADTPLSLRELFVLGDELVRKRYEPHEDTETFDRGIDPTTVAQEFIRDVILLRLQ